jgi:hypothetical protein
MVRGLFPRAEQDLVLAALEQSVVVVTSQNIQRLILAHGYDASAWTLANLYLASIDAELLSDDAPRLVGLSEETTCYVTPEAFSDEPFSDIDNAGNMSGMLYLHDGDQTEFTAEKAEAPPRREPRRAPRRRRW